MPPTIDAVVAREKATYRDLDEYFGVEDLYDLLEMIAVGDHNAEIVRRQTEGR